MIFLKVVYVLAMAALLTMFVAFGISAFYDAPEIQTPEGKAAEFPGRFGVPAPPVESPEYQEWWEEYQEWMEVEREYWEVYSDAMRVYHRNVLLIAYSVGLVFVVLGLVLRPRLDVIRTGLLLGGLTTIVYAVSQGFGDVSNELKFGAVAIGLAVLIRLGYRTLIEREQSGITTTEEKEGV